MSSAAGQPIDALDSPQLLLDLDVVDANAQRLLQPLRGRPIDVRVHEGTSMAVAVAPDGQTLALDLQGSIWLSIKGQNRASKRSRWLSIKALKKESKSNRFLSIKASKSASKRLPWKIGSRTRRRPKSWRKRPFSSTRG